MTVALTHKNAKLIDGLAKKAGLSLSQRAYVLATAYWETNRTMEPVVEAYWLSENWRLKNLRYYPWYGRGFVQLTWKANYEKASRKIGADLITHPDLARQPDIAGQILVRGMVEGWFTGRKLSTYTDATGNLDYVQARRIVNGTDKAKEIAAIAAQYEALLTAETPAKAGWLSSLLITLSSLFGVSK